MIEQDREDAEYFWELAEWDERVFVWSSELQRCGREEELQRCGREEEDSGKWDTWAMRVSECVCVCVCVREREREREGERKRGGSEGG